MYNLYSDVDLSQDIDFIEAQAVIRSCQEQNQHLIMRMKQLHSESFGGFVGYLFGTLMKGVGVFLAKLLVVLKKVLIVLFSTVVVAIARKVSEGKGSSVVGGGGGGNPNLGTPSITADSMKKAAGDKVTTGDRQRLRKYVLNGIAPFSIPSIRDGELSKADLEDVSKTVKLFIDEHRNEMASVEKVMRSNVDPISPLTFVIEEPAIMELIIESLNDDIASGQEALRHIDSKLGPNRGFNFIKEDGYKELEKACTLMGISNVNNNSMADTLVKLMSTALDAFAVCEINIQETLALITDGENASMIVDCKQYFDRVKNKIGEIDKYNAFNRIKKDMTMMESSGRYTELGMLDIIYKDQKVLFEKVGFPVDISKCKTITEANNKLGTVAGQLSRAGQMFDTFKSIKDVKLSLVDMTHSVSHTVVRIKMLPKVNPVNYEDGEEMAHQMMYSFLRSKEAQANNPSVINQKAKVLEKGVKDINDTLNKVELVFDDSKNFVSQMQDSCTLTNHISSIISSTTHLVGMLGMYKVGQASHLIQEIVVDRANILSVIKLQEMIENS